jgi:hypothetical protein
MVIRLTSRNLLLLFAFITNAHFIILFQFETQSLKQEKSNAKARVENRTELD